MTYDTTTVKLKGSQFYWKLAQGHSFVFCQPRDIPKKVRPPPMEGQIPIVNEICGCSGSQGVYF